MTRPNAAAELSSDEARTVRDARVDVIGFVAELQKKWTDDLRTAVKVNLLDKEAVIATGDSFQGRLVTPTERSIDPGKLLNLYARGRITRAQLTSALKVNVTAAAKFIAPQDLDKLCETAPGQPQLRVTKLDGAAVELIDAVKAIAAAAPAQKP